MKKLLTFDPGESTGYATWDLESGELLTAGTAGRTVVEDALAVGAELVAGPGEYSYVAGLADLADPALAERFKRPDLVIFENWQLYPPGVGPGPPPPWDECRTARHIGAIELICRLAGVPYRSQGAKIKGPAEAAGAEELFLRPLHENRHANDAIRHGVYHFKIARPLEQQRGDALKAKLQESA